MIYHGWCLSPAFIYIFGVHATNPEGINDGRMWLQYLFCTWEQIYFQRRGIRLGFNLWDAHYHSVWHTFTLAATVVAKQRTQLRTLKLHAGKIGPRGGSGRDWCQTSRTTRSTWGFNNISIKTLDGTMTIKMERRRVERGKILNVMYSGIKCRYQRTVIERHFLQLCKNHSC